MILLVDIGNTRIKWACRDQAAGLGEEGGLVHAEKGWERRLDDAWAQLTRSGDVERVVASCVADGRVCSNVAELVRQRWGKEPEWVVAVANGHGVRNAYAEPQRLGPDRWAALVAARALVGGAACIVDCGSAVTLDVLHADGRHLGGWILPGLRMMRRALSEQTGGLAPVSEPDEGLNSLGHDTQACILRGTRAAIVAAIVRGLEESAAVAGAAPTCLLTGGDAEALFSSLEVDIATHGPGVKPVLRLVPQLVLQGLSLIAGADTRAETGSAAQ